MSSFIYVAVFFIYCNMIYTKAVRSYIYEVPNGDLVPDPCNPQKHVYALGYIKSQNGSVRNKFGNDFIRSENWSKLCPLDSDEDGITNGEELGDPECKWKKGITASRITNLSHPGVCTPVNSSICKHLQICDNLSNWAGLFEETGTLDLSFQYSRGDDGFFKTSVILIVLLSAVKLVGSPELKYRIINGCCSM